MTGLPLYKQIIQDLQKKIFDGTLRPGDRIPSEHELSSSYMVSSITSKNALAELADKGYIIRQKGRGSFVNSLENLMAISDFAHTVSNRNTFQSKTIGLIIPSMKTGVDQKLLDCLEYEISSTEYLLTLVITRENQEAESQAIQKLVSQGASGLIIFPAEHEIYNESILRLNLEKYPFLLVDRYLKGIRTNTICTANYEATKQSVSHLISKNCKNIVFISPDSKNTVTQERFTAFKDALSENDIVINKHNSFFIPLEITDPSLKKSRIARFLSGNPASDGILCANREMAAYVVEIFNQKNLWEQFQICAFDYFDHPRVSYIIQDIPCIAHECILTLLDAISGNTVPRQVSVPASFVAR